MLRKALIFALFTTLSASAASAQRMEDATVSIRHTLPRDTVAAREPDAGRSRSRWVKGAMLGAIGGGLTFVALHWMAGDYEDAFPRNVIAGMVMGGVGGGVAIAFYDWVCAPDSASARAGLCGRGF